MAKYEYKRQFLRMDLIASSHWSNPKSGSRLCLKLENDWDRLITVDGQPIVNMGNVCGTCSFHFKFLSDDQIPSVEVESVRDHLEQGISEIGPTADALRPIIPEGDFVVALFHAIPRRAGSDDVPDYFSHEQSLVWKKGSFATDRPYFRAGTRPVMPDKGLFEFLIPFAGQGAVDEQRVCHYVDLLTSGLRPTAVSIGLLDERQYYDWPSDNFGEKLGPKYPKHWCFANYLLDGHHKVLASVRTGLPMTLLTFISLKLSWQLVDELISVYQESDSA